MRLKSVLAKGVAGAALCGATCLALSARADTPKDGVSQALDQNGASLGEIVVTAQKRAENIEKTPIAMTAITGTKIEQANLDQPERLQFAVPSMTFGNDNGYTYIMLRGVGNDSAALAESSVATYVDGVYAGQMIGESVPTYDLQRIEILRGPQGTLYGRNSDGGVINYITRDPSFNPGAYTSLSYGNYNALQFDGGITGPIVGDKLAGRFSVHYSDHDGYYQNIATGQRDYSDKNFGGRAELLWEPTDNLKVTIRGDMEQDNSNPSFALIHSTSLDGFTSPALPLGIFSEPAAYFTAHPGYLSPTQIAELNGGSIASHYGLIEPGPTPPDPFATRTVDNGEPTVMTADTKGASVTVDWDAGPAKVKSISAYRYTGLMYQDDTGGIGSPLVDINPYYQRDSQWTQEFDISGTAFGGKLDWLAGAFYLHDDGYFANTIWLPTYGEAENLITNLSGANPGYTYGLTPSLVNFTNLPGVTPNSLATVVVNGPNFTGGPLIAGRSIPSTAFFGFGEKQESQSVAGFIQATYHLTDRLRLTGGFRFTDDSKTGYRQVHSNLAYDLTEAALAPLGYTPAEIDAASGLCNTSTKHSWKAPTGLVDLDFDVAPHTLAYAKAAWGYKAGGMNPAQCTGVYNPEYLVDYEGGLKSVFADGQVLINLAIYHYDYTNIQFTSFVANSSEVLNAGSATTLGAEVEYALRPKALPGWELDGSASFEDSHYGPGCFQDPADLAGPIPLASDGLPPKTCPAGTPAWAQINGNALIRAPKWKTNVGLQYTADEGASGTVLSRVEVAWTDTIYNDIFNGKAPDLGSWTQPPYWILNARVVWTSSNGRYLAELFGDNLLNSIYATNRVAFDTPPSVYSVTGQLGPPRTFGARVTVKFGALAR